MAANIVCYKGAAAGEGFRVTINRSDSGLDLSTVASVSLLVKGRSGESAWTASIESQSAQQIVAAHDFAADGSETSKRRLRCHRRAPSPAEPDPGRAPATECDGERRCVAA
jgi:hypothetical protein